MGPATRCGEWAFSGRWGYVTAAGAPVPAPGQVAGSHQSDETGSDTHISPESPEVPLPGKLLLKP
jgi:hypothetical protein